MKMQRQVVAWPRALAGMTAIALSVLSAAGVGAETVPARALGSLPTSGLAQEPVVLSPGGDVLYLVYAEGSNPGQAGALRVHRSDDGGLVFSPYLLGPSAYPLDSVRDLKLFHRIDEDWLLLLIAAIGGEDRLLAFHLDRDGDLVPAYGEPLDLPAARTSRAHDLGPDDRRIEFYQASPHSFGGFTVVYQKAGLLLRTRVPSFGGAMQRSEISMPAERPRSYAGQTVWLEGADVDVGLYATPGDRGAQAVVFLGRDGGILERLSIPSDAQAEHVRGRLFEDLEGQVHVLLYDGSTARVLARAGGGLVETNSFPLPSADSLVEPFLLEGAEVYVTSGPAGLSVRRLGADGVTTTTTLSTLPARSDEAWKLAGGSEFLNHYDLGGQQEVFLALNVASGAWRRYSGLPGDLDTASHWRFIGEPGARIAAFLLSQGAAGPVLVGYRVGQGGFQEAFRIAVGDLGGMEEIDARLVSGQLAKRQWYLLEGDGRSQFVDELGNTAAAHETDGVRLVPFAGATTYLYEVDGSKLSLFSLAEGAEP